MRPSALVVLSGGQDSTLCLAWAKANFEEVVAVTFDYGQKHSEEIKAAERVSEFFGVCIHEIVTVGKILLGTSPLTNNSEELETYTDYDQMVRIMGDRREKTFVPMRNPLFLTLAANRAACLGIFHMVTGICEADGANYEDCRSSYIKSQEETINLALGFDRRERIRLEIHTPLINLTKDESILLGMTVPGAYEAWAYSHTAYDGKFPPEGHDHASLLRAHGFEVANIPDPLVVRAQQEGLLDFPDTGNYDIVRRNIPATIPDLVKLMGAASWST